MSDEEIPVIEAEIDQKIMELRSGFEDVGVDYKDPKVSDALLIFNEYLRDALRADIDLIQEAGIQGTGINVLVALNALPRVLEAQEV